MNLRFLETFLMVARLKSFSAAGERMNTTQAAVSSRIATLERQLGVRLFERDLRSVVLTPQGWSALARAEEIVKMVAEFRIGIGSPTTLSGTIAIGTVDTISRALAGDLLVLAQHGWQTKLLQVMAEQQRWRRVG